MIDNATCEKDVTLALVKHARACVCFLLGAFFSPALTADLDADEAKHIAEDAYIYAYPMLQNYKTMYALSIAGRNGNSPRPFNAFFHQRKLLGPDYTTIVGPNSDTLYSSAWLDLRREPLVISVPTIATDRYYSLQFVDAYVHNFAYIGQRATGEQSGNYLIYGRNQAWVDHPDIDGAFASESDFVFVIGRTLVRSQNDLSNVVSIQDQYLITPLSEFSGVPAPAPPENIDFPEYTDRKARSRNFVEFFNFLLSHVNVHANEKELFDRFRKIGIGSRNMPATLTDDILAAMDEGVALAYQKIQDQSQAIGSRINGWNTTFAGFGSRESSPDRIILRAAAAMLALYGNSREENSGFSRTLDAVGLALDGSKKRYSVTFAADQLPPTNAFWSLTMYRLPEVQLVRNDANRYSVGSRTGDLNLSPDGSLTIYLQHEAPDNARHSNWLPAPKGLFALSLRIYLPKENVLNGTWRPPQLVESR